MRTGLVSLVSLLSFALAGCAASPMAVEDSRTQESREAVSSATPAVSTSTAIPTDEWQTYNNAQAGYNAKYPVDWIVSESVGGNGELVTTFMAPDNEQGLTVSVLKGETIVEEVPDMPNTRCQQVTVSGLSGQRCLDTVAFSISTTFSKNNRQFAIGTIGKKPDQNIYQNFLESFILTP